MLLADCANVEQAPPIASIQLPAEQDSSPEQADLASLSFHNNWLAHPRQAIRGSPGSTAVSSQLPVYQLTLRLRL